MGIMPISQTHLNESKVNLRHAVTLEALFIYIIIRH